MDDQGLPKYSSTVERHLASEPRVLTGANFTNNGDFEVAQCIEIFAAV